MGSERCPGCGGWLAEGLAMCSPCRAKEREAKAASSEIAERQAKERAEALEQTKAGFPELFHDTDKSRLHAALVVAIDSHKPSERKSYVLFGETRAGKSRAAYLMAIAHATVCRKPALFLPMRRLEGTIEKGFASKRHAFEMDNIAEVSFLVLDDLDKVRLTERMAVELFGLIDERTSNRRPTIITTNLNGSALEERLSKVDPNLAAPFVARLREFFTPVSCFK